MSAGHGNRAAPLRTARAAAIIVCLAGADSAVAQRPPVPVVNADAFLEFRGFRIKPPRGGKWLLVERGRESVFFGRRTASVTHTFVALAFSESLPDAAPVQSVGEYFERVKRLKRHGMIPGRHWFLEEEFAMEDTPGPTCIRYRSKFLDTGSANAPRIPLVLESVGVSCLHPESFETVIDVRYEERGGPDGGTGEMRREGEEFIRGVEFTPLN